MWERLFPFILLFGLGAAGCRVAPASDSAEPQNPPSDAEPQPDTSPPSWSSGYPTLVAAAPTSAEGQARIDEDGTGYFIVRPPTSPAPTAAEVARAGAAAASAAGSAAGSIAGSVTLAAGVAAPFRVAGLTPEAEYVIDLVAADRDGNLQETPVAIPFTTPALPEDAAPTWRAGFPTVLSVAADGARCALATSAATLAYYVLTTAAVDAPAPSSADVRAGSAPGQTVVTASMIALTAGAEVELALTGLAPETAYRLFVVAEGTSPATSLMPSPATLDFVTAAPPGPHPSGDDFATAAYPLGATYVSPGRWTFGVYSKHATKVLLEIYDAPYGRDARHAFDLTHGAHDDHWRIELEGLPERFYYAYRAWGPNWPYDPAWRRGNSDAGFSGEDVDSLGNRFNPNKVLADPYARELSHDRNDPAALAGENGGIYGTGGLADSVPHGYRGPCTGDIEIDRREVDTGRVAPKAIPLVACGPLGSRPRIAPQDRVIYEAHVKGLTAHASASELAAITSGIDGLAGVVDVPPAYRGSYKGAGYMAAYLRALGVTTLELLPIAETDNERGVDGPSHGNFWGYSTAGFFAPDRHYAYDRSPGGPTRELKEMVRAFHDAGIEVFVDVVYNHTSEGGLWDATGATAELTSLRGLDNVEYYRVAGARNERYVDHTACGAELRAESDAGAQLILDSLAYWADEIGIDGFRFDLAPVLGRLPANTWAFQSDAATLARVRDLGAARDVAIIAEPWDVEWPGGYQISNFTPESRPGAKDGWAEWNGIFRDVVRRYIKGMGWKTAGYPSFGDVFYGSFGPLERASGHVHTGFADQGGPHKSINYVTAHDGFTMMDLVSYNAKVNGGAWPFGPSSGGSNDNESWDTSPATGINGPIAGISQQALRRQQLRNLWTLLLFARGVPMFVYGDELGRTQNGNNNPFELDSICTWNNYEMIASDSPNRVPLGASFTGAYEDNFGTDTNADGKNGLFLFVRALLATRARAQALRQDSFAMRISYSKADGSAIADTDRAARAHLHGEDVGASGFILCINMWKEAVACQVPAAALGSEWVRIIDTAAFAEGTGNIWPVANATVVAGRYDVNAMSIAVFEERPKR